MIRRREVRRMAAILCMITGMTAVPAYAAAPETFGAVPGMESDLGKVVLPYGKRCLEHRFYRR